MKEELGKKVTPEYVSTSIEDAKEIQKEELTPIMSQEEAAEFAFSKKSDIEKIVTLLKRTNGVIFLKDSNISWDSYKTDGRGHSVPMDGTIINVDGKEYGLSDFVSLQVEDGNLIMKEGGHHNTNDSAFVEFSKSTILCKTEDILSINTDDVFYRATDIKDKILYWNFKKE